MLSFADAYPRLAEEWSDLNGGLRPENVSYGSSKKIIWKGRCGHEWEATAKNRGRNGSGCPYCSGNSVLTGFNDLETLYPILADEWSVRNMALKPGDVTAKSNRDVWWECGVCGYEWHSRISDRTNGHGCPVCAGEKLVAGLNDLATEHPGLALEWSGRNTRRPEQTWSKSRENVWWACGKCGYEWTAVVDSRVKGLKCPNCMKLERRERYANLPAPYEIIKHYVQKSAIIIEHDTDTIGIPLDLYMPAQKTAIEYGNVKKYRGKKKRYENAKNWLCLKSGIRLIRVLPPGAEEFDNCTCITMADGSYGVFGEALAMALKMCGINADVDIGRDFPKLCGLMDEELLDRRSRSWKEGTWNQQGT